MFKIYDGRETFYQWDINQKLIVADDSITEVHFSNRTNSYSLVCDIYNEGDLRVVSVPNVLLQTNWPIKVYAYLKDHTEVSETFKVIEKDKPEDYVYTPDEVKTWEELNNRVTELEQSESVLYTAQELTEEQKAQARQNIGSFDFFEIPNLIKFNVKSKPIFGDKIVEGQVFALNDFQPIDIDTADAETIEAWRIVYNYFSLKPMQKFVSNISALQALALLIDKNMLGENFYSTHDYLNPALFGRNKKFIKVYSYYSNDAEKKVIAGFVYDLEQSLGQFKYNVLTNTIEYYNYSYPLTALADTSTDGKELISQTNMRADPTEPMQIATKQYVDNSIAAGGMDISLGLTSASVGQTIKVKAVDDTGKPTEWEAAEMAGDKWELINEITFSESANGCVINTDSNGAAFSLKAVKVECVIQIDESDPFTYIKAKYNNLTVSSNTATTLKSGQAYFSSGALWMGSAGIMEIHTGVLNHNYNWTYTINKMGFRYNDDWKQNSISQIKIEPNDGGKPLGTGTKIYVYGVRA